MRDSDMFAENARQQGFAAPLAHAALETIATRLQEHGHATSSHFYIYRTGQQESGGTADSPRPRLIPVFATADTALAFAQHNRLGPTPRLLRLSLARLLSVMVQRPTIETLLFVDEPPSSLPPGTLPAGFRLERDTLLNMLKGA